MFFFKVEKVCRVGEFFPTLRGENVCLCALHTVNILSSRSTRTRGIRKPFERHIILLYRLMLSCPRLSLVRRSLSTIQPTWYSSTGVVRSAPVRVRDRCFARRIPSPPLHNPNATKTQRFCFPWEASASRRCASWQRRPGSPWRASESQWGSVLWARGKAGRSSSPSTSLLPQVKYLLMVLGLDRGRLETPLRGCF